MDYLIKQEHDSMLVSQDSFPMPIHAHDYQETSAWRISLVISAPAELPMVQTRNIPLSKAANTSLLTIRETEILELLGKGLSVKGAARDLAISPGTVKWHVKNLYYKLGANSREDALNKARLRKLIK